MISQRTSLASPKPFSFGKCQSSLNSQGQRLLTTLDYRKEEIQWGVICVGREVFNLLTRQKSPCVLGTLFPYYPKHRLNRTTDSLGFLAPLLDSNLTKFTKGGN